MECNGDRQLFIFGPPRSGTTFLSALLNTHPRIFVTNELRVLDFVNATMRDKASDHHLIHNAEYRNEFIAKIEPSFASLIKDFYVEKLRAKTPEAGIWGDKTPGYGDPRLSPGCLETIDRLFPESKFILVVRNPFSCVNSIVAKRWETLDGAVDLWSRIILNGRRFGREIGSSRFLEVSHERMLKMPFAVLAELEEFLGIQPSAELRVFVEGQEQKRIPYSDPVSMSADPYRMTEEQVARMRELLGMDLIDVDASLAHYSGVEKDDPFRLQILETKNEPLPFRVESSKCSGEGEIMITAFDVAVNGEKRQAADLECLTTNCEIVVEMDLDATRAIEELVVGYILTATDGAHLHAETNISRGLAPCAIGTGRTRVVQHFRWPSIGEQPCTMTLVVGEGNHSTNHVRQCWVHHAIKSAPMSLPEFAG